MTKTATISVRVDQQVKAKAEKILSKIGISMSDTISLLLHQIALQKGIPFELKVPNAETRQAMADVDAGRVETFNGTAKELVEHILNDHSKSAK